MKLSHIPVSVRSRTWAEYAIRLPFTSILTSLVCGCDSDTHCPSGLPSHFRSLKRSWFVAATPLASRSREWGLLSLFLAKNSTLFCLTWPAVLCWQQDKMAESRDRSSSTKPQLKFPGCSHYRRRSDNHFWCQQCPLNEGLTLCTQEAPCDVCKDWLPEVWQALEKAVQQKRKCKATAAAKKSQEMNKSIEIHASEEGLQVPPVKRRDDGSSKKLDSMKRADSATSSASKATEAESVGRPSRSRDKKKTLSSSVSVVGRSRSDGGPVPSGTKGSERHRSRSGDRGRRSHRSERRHDSPRSHHSPRRRQSGERARPTSSSGGSSSRSRQADSTDAPGSGRASVRATEVRPSSSSTHHQHHHSRASVDHRSLFSSSRSSVDIGPCPSLIIIMEDVRVWTRRSLSRPTCPDVRSSCHLSHHKQRRREPSQWFRRLPGQQRWTTRQVWWARQTRQLWPTRQMWRARWTQQRFTTQQVTSQQEITTQQRMTSPRLWTTWQVLPTLHRNKTQQVPTQTGVDSAQPQDSAVDDSARGDEPVAQGTPAGTTPAVVQDTSMVSDVNSLLFPLLPRTINQANLLEFMSRMTLLQRRMDLGLPVPDTQSRPIDQTPTTRDDQTPPRGSKTTVECSRTPVRRSRTPVRRSRGMDKSSDSIRSRSPIRRSSSSESCPRDASPVDFSAALDTEEKVKVKSISKEEDDKGSQRKVSAAQYQLFRQAVTSSKGMFKVNPAKCGRASRASLPLSRRKWSDGQSLMVGPAVSCWHHGLYSTHSTGPQGGRGSEEDHTVWDTQY